MYAARYFARHYYAAHYFPPSSTTPTPTPTPTPGRTQFGYFCNGFFPKRQFAERYFPGAGYGSSPVPPTPTPTDVLLGGGPGKRKKKPSDYFFTPAWQKFEQEVRALESQAAEREKTLTAVSDSAYEFKVRQEINDLRMRRDRLIRQMREEEVIISILHGMPSLY